MKEHVKDNWLLEKVDKETSSIHNVKRIILCEWYMVSYLMGMRGYAVDEHGNLKVDDNGNKVNVVDEEVYTSSQLIRLFLTMLYDHEESMGAEKHMWLSHYNFLCLLNLPEQIQMLGPPNNCHKGRV